jgi:hypothetical protein
MENHLISLLSNSIPLRRGRELIARQVVPHLLTVEQPPHHFSDQAELDRATLGPGEAPLAVSFIDPAAQR